MYTAQYKFKFNESIEHPERMRLFAKLLELPNNTKIEERSIYSYSIKHNGNVNFSSSHPTTCEKIKSWLNQQQEMNVLTIL